MNATVVKIKAALTEADIEAADAFINRRVAISAEPLSGVFAAFHSVMFVAGIGLLRNGAAPRSIELMINQFRDSVMDVLKDIHSEATPANDA